MQLWEACSWGSGGEGSWPISTARTHTIHMQKDLQTHQYSFFMASVMFGIRVNRQGKNHTLNRTSAERAC